MLITAFEGEDLIPHKMEDSKMYPLKLLKNRAVRIQQKSNWDSGCSHRRITIMPTLSRVQPEVPKGDFILRATRRGTKSWTIGFITSTYSTPKWHERQSYYTQQTTFGVKEVMMDQGGKRSWRSVSKSPFQRSLYTHHPTSLSLIRLGNQGLILR